MSDESQRKGHYSARTNIAGSLLRDYGFRDPFLTGADRLITSIIAAANTDEVNIYEGEYEITIQFTPKRTEDDGGDEPG